MMNKTNAEIIEQIKNYAGKIAAKEIAVKLGLTYHQVKHTASRNKISLSIEAKTCIGEPCSDCGSTIRYVSCNNCVPCKRQAANESYLKSVGYDIQTRRERQIIKLNDKKANIINLVNQGLYLSEICEVTGMPSSTLAQFCKRHNIPVKRARIRKQRETWEHHWYHDDFDPRPNTKYLSMAWL